MLLRSPFIDSLRCMLLNLSGILSKYFYKDLVLLNLTEIKIIVDSLRLIILISYLLGYLTWKTIYLTLFYVQFHPNSKLSTYSYHLTFYHSFKVVTRMSHWVWKCPKTQHEFIWCRFLSAEYLRELQWQIFLQFSYVSHTTMFFLPSHWDCLKSSSILQFHKLVHYSVLLWEYSLPVASLWITIYYWLTKIPA